MERALLRARRTTQRSQTQRTDQQTNAHTMQTHAYGGMRATRASHHPWPRSMPRLTPYHPLLNAEYDMCAKRSVFVTQSEPHHSPEASRQSSHASFAVPSITTKRDGMRG